MQKDFQTRFSTIRKWILVLCTIAMLCIIGSIFVEGRKEATKNSADRQVQLSIHGDETDSDEIEIFMIHKESKVSIPIQNEEQDKDISLLFFGDLIYDRNVYKQLPDMTGLSQHFEYRDQKTQNYEWEMTSLHEIAKQTDIVGFNLESAIGRFWSGEKEVNICLHTQKSIAFCSHEDILPILKELWFTVANLANNHVMDGWVQAHLKTIELLEKYGIKYFGFVSQWRYFQQNYIYTGQKNGQLFARHGYDYTIRNNLHERYCQSLQSYHNEWYKNFVVVHRWIEYTNTHSTSQEKIAKKLIDCWADLILGGHPHVIQDTQIYSGKVVVYSLWNFLFDQYFDPRTQLGWYAMIHYDIDTQTSKLYTGTVPAGAKK